MARRRARTQINPLVALATLNRVLGETPEYVTRRREVLARYARLNDQGVPVLCEPPRRELLMDRVPGAFKVIYDSERNAIDAAWELSALGAPPSTPYLCEINPDGHLHLGTLDDYKFEKEC